MTTDFIPTILKFRHRLYLVPFKLYRSQFLSILVYLFVLLRPFLLGPSCRFDWISKDREPRETRGLVFQIETVETRTGLELAQSRAASARLSPLYLTPRICRTFKGYALSRIVSFFFPISSRNICEIIDVETVVREKKDRTIRNELQKNNYYYSYFVVEDIDNLIESNPSCFQPAKKKTCCRRKILASLFNERWAYRTRKTAAPRCAPVSPPLLRDVIEEARPSDRRLNNTRVLLLDNYPGQGNCCNPARSYRRR